MSIRSWLGLALIAVAAGVLALWYLEDRREYKLSIAAGQKSEQAFQLGRRCEPDDSRPIRQAHIASRGLINTWSRTWIRITGSVESGCEEIALEVR